MWKEGRKEERRKAGKQERKMTFKSGRKCENRLGPGKNILFYLKDIKMVAQTNGFRVSISKVRPET